MSEKALRVVATGDMFITRRIAEDGYEGFEELSDCIKEHDVKFSNLEMTFHNQEGYPAAVRRYLGNDGARGIRRCKTFWIQPV